MGVQSLFQGTLQGTYPASFPEKLESYHVRLLTLFTSVKENSNERTN